MTMRRSGLVVVAMGLVAVLVATGCLPFPLGDPTQSKVDSKLLGFWLNDASEDRDLIALYPFDEHTYVMQDQKLHHEDGKWSPQGPPSIFKAWLVQVNGHRFLSLEPLFQKVVPQEHNIYPAMLLETAGEVLKTRLVNADFEPLKNVKTAAEELAIVTKEVENPKLFDESQSTFRKLDAERDKDTIEFVVKS